jgi:hypothetical protein
VAVKHRLRRKHFGADAFHGERHAEGDGAPVGMPVLALAERSSAVSHLYHRT